MDKKIIVLTIGVFLTSLIIVFQGGNDIVRAQPLVSGEVVDLEGNDYLTMAKALLGKYPEDYPLEQAIGKGDYIIAHEIVKDGQMVWDKFYADTQERKRSDITIIEYTIEGDAIISYLLYEEGNFFYLKDTTRDAFGVGDYWSNAFRYLKVFENADKTIGVLLNEDMTYEEYEKSVDDSNNTNQVISIEAFQILK